MRTLDVIAGVLLIVGGLNWGLVGLADFDLVARLFGGQQAIVSRLVYTLVGLSAVYGAVFVQGVRNRWSVQRAAEKAPVKSI